MNPSSPENAPRCDNLREQCEKILAIQGESLNALDRIVGLDPEKDMEGATVGYTLLQLEQLIERLDSNASYISRRLGEIEERI